MRLLRFIEGSKTTSSDAVVLGVSLLVAASVASLASASTFSLNGLVSKPYRCATIVSLCSSILRNVPLPQLSNYSFFPVLRWSQGLDVWSKARKKIEKNWAQPGIDPGPDYVTHFQKWRRKSNFLEKIPFFKLQKVYQNERELVWSWPNKFRIGILLLLV